MVTEISKKMINKFSNQLQQEPHHNVLKNAMMKNGLLSTLEDNQSVIKMNHVFSEEIKSGKVPNQELSGRCWMFAALNSFNNRVNEQFNLLNFELSQNYLTFWDKFEKSNYFLENILKTAELPLDDRIIFTLLSEPQQDGGQWDMLVSLISKYGVVPKHVMPETFQSNKPDDFNNLLNSILRKDAHKLRQLSYEGASQDQLNKEREDMLRQIYKFLVYSLGEPPQNFVFEYRDNDHVFYRDVQLTPHAFFDKYVNLDLNSYVSLINAPTKDKPYGKTYTVDYLGNVVGGQPIKYLNVDMETLKRIAIKQIIDREGVWFGCDVDQESNRDKGIMDTALFSYEETFGFPIYLSKAERLDYNDGKLTHAMVLTGVDLVDDQPVRWKVENSWGDKVGNHGYFVMSDEWMEEYTYQIVVNKKYLSAELKTAWEQEPIHLKPWDPMGALAIMR